MCAGMLVAGRMCELTERFFARFVLKGGRPVGRHGCTSRLGFDEFRSRPSANEQGSMIGISDD